MDPNTRRLLSSIVLGVFVPATVLSIYLWTSRANDTWQGTNHDRIALAFSVACGLSGVFILPASRRFRAMFAVAYVPIAGAALTLYFLLFVCGAFGACV